MTPKFAPALTNLPLVHQGKTRDTFLTKSPDHLLIVATNRLSTHNVIHLSTVPKKGEVLTALTIFWLVDLLDKAGIPHHLVAYGTDIYKYLLGKRSDYPADLHYRAIVVKKLKMIPVEFIYRNYLAGSLYDKFYKKGLPNPYGIALEPGLQLMSPFPHPTFTPTDKSETDEPMESEATKDAYFEPYAMALAVFEIVRDHLRTLSLELVDSKFEVGICEHSGMPITTIGDEIATPDSSRFCTLPEITLGQEPKWLDKQIARDEAMRVWGNGPKYPLEFKPEIIAQLSDTYSYICARITGTTLRDFQSDRLD